MNSAEKYYTRERFLSLLKELYSPVLEEDAYSVKFRDITNKQIAEQLAISEQHYSKVCKPSYEGKFNLVIMKLEKEKRMRELIDTSEKASEKAAALEEQLKSSSRTKKSLKWIALALLFFGFGLGYIIPTNRTGSELDRLSIKGVQELMHVASRRNINRYELEASMLNSEIKKLGRPMTFGDSLRYVKKIKRTVSDVVSKERKEFKMLCFTTEWGEKVGDLIETVAPFETLFKCPDSLLVSAKALPDNATPFDEAVFGSKEYIFNKEVNAENLTKNIDELVSIVMGKLDVGVKRYMEAK